MATTIPIPIPTILCPPPFHKPPVPMTLGEAPLYRLSDSTLHWVDPLISPPELHILPIHPLTGVPLGPSRTLQLSDSVSVFYFRKNVKGSYIWAYYAGIAYMDEETGKLEVLREIIGNMRMRKAVAFGLGGPPETYGKPRGRLWMYDPDGSLHQMFEGVVCGNGIDWSPDNKTFYLNDSVGQMVYAFDFDLEQGSISNQTTLVDFHGTEGEPDGMVVDTDGNLWIAVYGTNRVMVFDPSGKKIKELVFSGNRLTCPTWGGVNHDILFISSAKGGEGLDGKADEGGNMFNYKVMDGPKGKAEHEFAG
ncbi:SMP-30/Gluconolaconase/LRE domain-containing protein [Cadophora sp. MPI-SDFR-AT-0126]|nr:SMP-30/Gluconolaconase/LRE domain-containing protein [Leotiomycetes sp. MPI-SDFR-AT-0126]